MTDISFITINYNSSIYTIELVKSIKKYTSLNYEIIIVDNDSIQEEKSLLKEFCKNEQNISLIFNDINCGFACGNMIGAKIAKGKYLFFINNDAKLLNDASKYMKDFLDTHKQTALCTAKIIDENNRFSSSYKLFPSLTKEILGNFIARLFNKYPSNKVILNEPTEVDVVSGSCMFFKKEVFFKINGFDTNFFLYCEEEDISKRIKDAGYKVFFLPNAIIYHKGGGSQNQNFDLLKEFYISYTYLIYKHFSPVKANLLYLLMILKIIRRSFKNKNYKNLIPYISKKFSQKYSLRHKYENN